MSSLSSVADALEIVGFLLTLVVYLNVRKIRRGYLFTARVPELLEKLSIRASELSRLQPMFNESIAQIRLELGRAEVLLMSIQQKVDGAPRRTVKRTIKSIRNFPERSTPPGLADIYLDIQKCLATLRELESDLKWEKR